MLSGSFRRSSPPSTSEGAELHLVVAQAGVKGIEIRNAVDAQGRSLAVEHEAPLADLPNANSHNSAFGTLPGKGCCLSTVVVDPILLECLMSKHKPATASKRARGQKIGARTQRSKQAIVRSPKDNLSRSVAIGAIESPLKLHDDSSHQSSVVEKAGVLQDELGQKMRDSDLKQGFALATANMQACQVKLLEIAQANVQFAFEFGLRLSAIRSPIDFFAVISEFTSRRVDMFGQHSKELAAYPFWRIEPPRKLTALLGR
jgi:hypothetical protein